MSSQVFDPLMPSLSSFCAVEKPGIPYKTGFLDAVCCGTRVRVRTDPENNAQIYLFNNESCDASLVRARICLRVNN